jgi:hypothetical protein
MGWRTFVLLMGEKCEPTGTSALPGGSQASFREPSNPLKPCAAVSIKVPSTPHCPQGPTSGHQPVQRPQVYCYTPLTTDLRPRTGAWAPVQQHAQACCEPLTSRGPERATRRSTRSRAAKCEPTGTSALPGGGRRLRSASPVTRSSLALQFQSKHQAHPTARKAPPPAISRLNVLKSTATPHPQRTSDLARGPGPPCSSTLRRAANL